jgi:hypothetical protein
MQVQTHPLESFFQHAVRGSYEERLGLEPEISAYVARMLCEFSDAGNLFLLRDQEGRPIEKLDEMVRASDPITGIAPSFVAERAARKYIGDYALFVAGMCPEAVELDASAKSDRPSLSQLIRIGKESYNIVSQFNIFEFKKEAALYEHLAAQFEHCVLGLALVRRELWQKQFTAIPAL